MRQRARGCFGGISQHQDGGFFELWLRSGITKVRLVYLFAVARLLLSLLQKEMQRSCSMMLRNKVSHTPRQTDFFRQLQSISNMTRDDLGAGRRTEAVVWVGASLVLDKVIGRRHLADIVVKRSDARQQSVSADGAAGVFSQLSHRMRVLICPRRPQSQLTQDR